MFKIQKLLPISVLTIGCCALTFQTTVLHPYHNDLDEEFKQIREMEEQDKKFEVFELEALKAVNDIGDRVDHLMKLKAKSLFEHVV